MGIVAVEHDQSWLGVRFSDGTTEWFLGTWLRDNIASGLHSGGGQRTFDINSMPEVTIADATHDADRVAVQGCYADKDSLHSRIRILKAAL